MRRIVAISLMAAAATLPTRGQAGGSAGPATVTVKPTRAVVTTRWLQLAPDQIEHYRAIALARQRQREAYIRASEDEDVILLAPYIVDSGESPTLARLRRDLQMGLPSHVSRIPEITPMLDPHLRLADNAENAFFGGNGDPASALRVRQATRSVGAPADTPAMGLINPLGLVEFFHRHSLANIFAAPADSRP